MGRRRKKVLRVLTRSLPKVFSCPRCGVVAVRITSQVDDTSQEHIVTVACGNCALRREFKSANEKPPIDAYNAFVDDFAKTGV